MFEDESDAGQRDGGCGFSAVRVFYVSIRRICVHDPRRFYGGALPY